MRPHASPDPTVETLEELFGRVAFVILTPAPQEISYTGIAISLWLEILTEIGPQLLQSKGSIAEFNLDE
jgi:hypothetical protein